jgi:hypothetical protein
VPDAGTRPTSDRVRESLFGSLESADAVRDAVVLDLFAGSGALGLEALSRGAAAADLVEKAPRAASVAERNARAVAKAGTPRRGCIAPPPMLTCAARPPPTISSSSIRRTTCPRTPSRRRSPSSSPGSRTGPRWSSNARRAPASRPARGARPRSREALRRHDAVVAAQRGLTNAPRRRSAAPGVPVVVRVPAEVPGDRHPAIVTGTTPRARTRPIAANPDGSARSRSTRAAWSSPRAARRRRGPRRARSSPPRRRRGAWHPAADRRRRPSSRSHPRAPPRGRDRSAGRAQLRGEVVALRGGERGGSTGIGAGPSRNRSNSSASPGRGAEVPRRRRRHPGAPRPQHGLGASSTPIAVTAIVKTSDAVRSPSTPQPGRARRTPPGGRARGPPRTTPMWHREARARRTAPSGRAHRGDVGEVDGRRLPAEVVAARPREPEVRSVHERVGRDDDASPGAESTAASSPGPTSARDEPCSAASTRASTAFSPRAPTVSSGDARACVHPSTVAWWSVPTARAALVLVVAAVAALSPAARRPSR